MKLFEAYDLLQNSQNVEFVRSKKTTSIHDVSIEMNKDEPIFLDFFKSPLSIDYIANELRWYLNGSIFDLSIAKKASIWNDHITTETYEDLLGKHHISYINSNYGHILFNKKHLLMALNMIIYDQNTRRASISLVDNDKYFFKDNKDFVCTTNIHFSVNKKNELEMRVNMRSQDAYLGMRNDLFFFRFVHAISAIYLNMPIGKYVHNVINFHYYHDQFENFMNMIEKELHIRKFIVPDRDLILDMLYFDKSLKAEQSIENYIHLMKKTYESE